MLVIFREKSEVDPEKVIRERGRTIKKGRYRDVALKGDFVLKEIKAKGLWRKLKATFLKRRLLREVENSKRLLKCGFKTPDPVFWGYEKKGPFVEKLFICYRYIKGRSPELEDLPVLVELLGSMNKRGIFLEDPHIQNFLMAEKPYILDTYYISFRMKDPLKPLAKLLNPAFSLGSYELIQELISLYEKSSGIKIQREGLLKELKKHLAERGRARIKSFEREVFKASRFRALGEEELILKKSSKAVTIDAEDAVLKFYYFPFYKKDRGLSGYLGAKLLNSYSIPSPEPLLLVRRRGILYSSSLLVIKKLKGKTLDSIIERWGEIPFSEKMRIIRSLADTISQLYSRSIFHRDLKPRNLLWDGNSFYLLDPESVEPRAIGMEELSKNMAQLYRGAAGKVSRTWMGRLLKFMANSLRKNSLWTSFKETWRNLEKGIGRYMRG